MKKSLYAILGVFLSGILFAGCEKDDTVSFKAVSGRYTGAGKAYVNSSHYACWLNGDRVKINNTVATVSIATEDGSSTVTLTGVPKSDQGYYAIYPAAMSSTQFTNGASITLPSVQEYTEVGGNQVLQAPMVAKASANREMHFSNLCSLLKIHIAQVNNSLKAIRLEATDESVKLSGTGTVTFDGSGTPSLSMTSGQNTVTLNMSSLVNMNVSGGRDFYIAIPPLASGKSINIYTVDILDSQRKLTITSQQAIPQNVIIGLNGPEMLNNGDYDFYDWIYSAYSGSIDLGVKPAVNSKMEMTFMLAGSDSRVITESQYIAASRGTTEGTSNTRWFALGGAKADTEADTANGFSVYVAGKEIKFQSGQGWDEPRARGKKYFLSGEVLQNAQGYLYGRATVQNLTDATAAVTKTSGASTYTSIPSTAKNVSVFNDGTTCHRGLKCYSFKYYENDVLIHNFVPCKRKADNVVGVYDIATGTFIQPVRRSQSATQFTVGNDTQSGSKSSAGTMGLL